MCSETRLPFGTLCAAAVLCAASAALAQTTAPAVQSLSFPLTLRGHVESGREHGCSLSHESVSSQADLELTIDRAGNATLRLVGHSSRTSGPSRGAWAAGDHDVSSVTRLDEVLWTGSARIDASGVVTIGFTTRAAATLLVSGFGRAPLPPAVTSTLALSATCSVVDRDVMPAVWTDGEVASSRRLAVCEFVGGMPAPIESYLGSGSSLVFGAGSGVRTLSEDPMWGTVTRLLRLAE